MPYSKKFTISLVVILIVSLTGIFWYSNKKNNTIEKISQSFNNNSQTSSKQNESISQKLTPKETEINYNKQQTINKNQQINIPKKFQVCQEKANMIDCIIKLDTENGKTDPTYILQKDNLTKRLDSIDNFIDEIETIKSNSISNISSKLEETYINQPDIVFKKIECQTNTCKSIINQTFKKIIDRYYARGQIKEKTTCNKIQNTTVQEHCLNKLN